MKDVLALTEYQKDGEKKTRWTRVGVAFENKDGSLSIMLDALPVSGRLQVREQRPKGERTPFDE